MDRKTYAANTQRASYFWEAERNGLIVASEYDIHGNEMPLRDAHLNQVDFPDGTYGFRNDTDATLRIYAKPYRPTTHANFFFDIGPGEVLIWKHFVIGMSLSVDLSGGEAGFTPNPGVEFLFFGRRTDTQTQVIIVDPLGNWEQHSSEAEVMELFK